jgi:hypothetical protein
VLALPMPLAAGVAALLVVALTLGLWANLGHQPVGATPSPSPSPSPTAACSVEIAVSGASPLIVGRGFKPDTDVVLEIDRADGSHVTIRPTDLAGLHTDDQGRFGVTLFASEPDVGRGVITAISGCTASVENTITADQLTDACPHRHASALTYVDTAAYRAAVDADSPSHWWHFDDGDTDFYADAAGNVDGARVGNVQPMPADGDAHAAFFDGAGSYVSLPTISLSDFTIEAWVYLCDLVSNEDAIVGHGRGTPNLNFFDTHLRLFVGGDSGDLLIATTEATDEQWTHWTLTRQGAAIRLYRDGVLDASASGWTEPMLIDQVGRGDVGELRGVIDELAIYSHALTADQIAAHFAAAP